MILIIDDSHEKYDNENEEIIGVVYAKKFMIFMKNAYFKIPSYYSYYNKANPKYKINRLYDDDEKQQETNNKQ